MFKMGFAQCSITPNIPCQLAGYAAYRPAEGVHDELYGGAVALRDGDKTTILLHFDLLGVDRLFMEAIDVRLREIGLGIDQLLLCSTHTHSGFGGIFDTGDDPRLQKADLRGGRNDALLEMLVDRSVKIIREALADLEGSPRGVKIRMMKDTVEGVATNRHASDEPCDKGIFVVELTREDGKKVLLYNLSCHPTLMSRENKLITADIPGYARAALKDHCDLALFINGSAGDMSTRFTRRESSFTECERMGNIIGDKVVEMLAGGGQAAPLEQVTLVYHTVPLNEAAIDTLENAERKHAEAEENLRKVMAATDDPSTIRKSQSFVEGASANLAKAKGLQGKVPGQIPIRVGLLTLNGQRIVCSPFELFSVLAIQLKAKVPVEMFGYANNVHGYLADTTSYENLDYEALSSSFAAGEGERYIGWLTQLLS